MTEKKEIITYSLSDLKQLGAQFDNEPESIDDDVIIFRESDVDVLRESRLFTYPCRIDAAIFIFCESGAMSVSVNLKTYQLTRGMALLVLTGNIMQVHYTDHFRVRGILVSSEFMCNTMIESKVAMPLRRQFQSDCCLSFTDEQISELDEYYALFFRTLSCPEALYKSETFRSLITAALYRIGTIFVSKIKAEGNRSANNRQMALFERFMQLLETHHATERNIAFYADRLFLTPKHVSKVILEVSGKTPTQWIDEYVVLEAKSLLKYSNLTIQEIADYLNFSTQSVFGKYFKHKTGLSPREYKAS